MKGVTGLCVTSGFAVLVSFMLFSFADWRSEVAHQHESLIRCELGHSWERGYAVYGYTKNSKRTLADGITLIDEAVTLMEKSCPKSPQ